MTVGHIFVISFMVLTAVCIVWLEMNSRKNTQKNEEQKQEEGSRKFAGGGSR